MIIRKIREEQWGRGREGEGGRGGKYGDKQEILLSIHYSYTVSKILRNSPFADTIYVLERKK